ncbi:MAG: acyltransferase [Solobacterium sp.]|nr:acyltransferase [Solobacterium sp.]
MSKNRDYYYGLDLLRIISTIAVLVYHISSKALPGGYLAVCLFLVMHGYLFALSASKQRSFSILSYYGKRFWRLYVPMFIVVAISVFCLRFTPDVIWLNEKPETLSVLGGYNNWWQIAANQSYFTRLTDSPFIPMWYLSMLLQIELLLPWLYQMFLWIKKRLSFWTAWLLFLGLTVASSFVMPYLFQSQAPEMRIYFGTDARIFSVLMGVSLGLLHGIGLHFTIPFLRNKGISELLVACLFALLGYMLFTIDNTSSWYQNSFLYASLLGIVLIALLSNKYYPVFRSFSLPIIKLLASISFEVYLTHYPLLFFALAKGEFTFGMRILYCIAVLICSILLHEALQVKLRGKKIFTPANMGRLALFCGVLYLSVHGANDIRLAKDHREEMEELKEQLAANEALLNQMQASYLEKRKEEFELMKDPAWIAEEEGTNTLPITGIGDSVMLGAIKELYETFPNGDFDAAQSRQYSAVPEMLDSRIQNNTLGNPVLLGVGTNGVMPIDACREIVKECGDRYVYWLTTTNDWQFENSGTIREMGLEFHNVTVIDWGAYAQDHENYFYVDGIHLTDEGRKAYCQYILDTIDADLKGRKVYKESGDRVVGIGEAYVLSALEYLNQGLEDCYIIAQENLNVSAVEQAIQSLRELEDIPSKVFLSLGNAETISQEELKHILELLPESKVLIVKIPGLKENETNQNIDAIVGNYPNVTVASWEHMYQEHPEYFVADRIHLNEEGNRAFAKFVIDSLYQLDAS